jgi:hypothetical protein
VSCLRSCSCVQRAKPDDAVSVQQDQRERETRLEQARRHELDACDVSLVVNNPPCPALYVDVDVKPRGDACKQLLNTSSEHANESEAWGVERREEIEQDRMGVHEQYKAEIADLARQKKQAEEVSQASTKAAETAFQTIAQQLRVLHHAITSKKQSDLTVTTIDATKRAVAEQYVLAKETLFERSSIVDRAMDEVSAFRGRLGLMHHVVSTEVERATEHARECLQTVSDEHQQAIAQVCAAMRIVWCGVCVRACDSIELVP